MGCCTTVSSPRHLSESRNGSLEGMGLKRLPNFGLAHNREEIAIADFLVNLRTGWLPMGPPKSLN